MGKLIVYCGICTAIISNTIQSLGLTLQRKATLETPNTVYHNFTWQLGLCFFLLSNVIGSTIQIATLPLIILAPLQSCGLLFNSWFSYYILREQFTRKSCYGTILIFVGGLMIATMGSILMVSELSHSYEQLVKLATNPPFLRYFILSNVMALLILFTCFLTNEGVSFAIVSGIWSAHCLLLAKSISDIFTTNIINHLPLFTKQILLIISCFLILSLLQLYLLNISLRYLTTSILYPLIFLIYNIVTMMNTILFYENSQGSWHLFLGISFGMVILGMGVFILSQSSQDTNSRYGKLRRHSILSYTSIGQNDYGTIFGNHSNVLLSLSSNNEYISLPKLSKYKRILSFEQEGLLQQMV